MIDLGKYFDSKDKILIVPRVMKSYFLEYKKAYPKTHFKLFTIDELFKELVGNYYSKEAIKFGLDYFNKYTYASIKEINEVVFKTFHIEEASEELKNYEAALKENSYKKFDNDLALLLKSLEIIVVGLSESSTLKSLFNELKIDNVLYLEALDVIETSLEKIYWVSNNINEEVVTGLNCLLAQVDLKKEPAKFGVCLDVNRYEYYINTYLEGINVPYYINAHNTLIDTKTYKYIYKYIKEDINIVEFLKEHKNDLEDDPNYEAILSLLEYFEVDKLPQKKINIVEILKSQSQEYYQYTNDITFSSGIEFSSERSILVFGLDQSFMPSSIKDTGIISFNIREKLGLDSFNEANLMNVKLEEAFIKQDSVRYIFFHKKDNNGRNNESYFTKFLKLMITDTDIMQSDEIKDGKQKIMAVFYSNNLFKINYRKEIDFLEETGQVTERAKYYFKYYGDKLLPVYSNEFKPFEDFKLDKEIIYSYSALDLYNKCPFAYYCNYILKLSEFEDTIYTKFGTVAHAILEKIYENSFDFDKISQFEIKKYQEKNGAFTKKELALLPRFLDEVKKTCELILEHKHNMSLTKTYSEKSFDIVIKRKDIDYIEVDDELQKIESDRDVKFTGRIDRIIETSDNSIYLIDYKTGDASFSRSAFMKNNECSQLPAYITLLDHTNDSSFEGKIVTGLFIQPLLIKDKKFYNYLKPSEEDLKTIRLQGLFLDDIDRLSKFDYLISKEDSKFVAGLRTTADGNKLNKLSKKTITNEDINDFREHFEKFLKKSSRSIEKADFRIRPIQLRVKTSTRPCSYCKFKDICLADYEVEDFNE